MCMKAFMFWSTERRSTALALTLRSSVPVNPIEGLLVLHPVSQAWARTSVQVLPGRVIETVLVSELSRGGSIGWGRALLQDHDVEMPMLFQCTLGSLPGLLPFHFEVHFISELVQAGSILREVVGEARAPDVHWSKPIRPWRTWLLECAIIFSWGTFNSEWPVYSLLDPEVHNCCKYGGKVHLERLGTV